MRFRTKKEVLEYLGKNTNDRKLVDRMITRWEIIMTNWEYELVDAAENNTTQHTTLPVQDKQLTTPSSSIEKEYEELKVNYEYLHKKFQRLKEWYNLVIDLTYQVVSRKEKIEKSEYKGQLADEVNRILDEKYGRLD